MKEQPQFLLLVLNRLHRRQGTSWTSNQYSFCCQLGAFPTLLKFLIHVYMHVFILSAFLLFTPSFFSLSISPISLKEKKRHENTLPCGKNEQRKSWKTFINSPGFFNWASEHFLMLLATTILDLLCDCTALHYIDVTFPLQSGYL